MPLTALQRSILLEHVDRPDGVPVVAAGRRGRAIAALLRRGLLRGDGVRPRVTYATDVGREETCRLLGQMADAAEDDTRHVFTKRNGETAWQWQAPNGRWQPKTTTRRPRAEYMRQYKKQRRERDPEFWRINGG